MAILVALVVVIIVIAMSLKVVKQDHRLLVIRMGRLTGVRGPGLIFVLPVIDRGVDVDLEQWVPGWRGLGSSELESRVLAVYLNPNFQ